MDDYYERRSDPRNPTACAFWFRQVPGGQLTSGWMFNHSAGGAAFLAAAADAPEPGDRLTLSDMYCPDRFVRDRCPFLPRYARVVRLDHEDGVTRRVAIRFEVDVPADLQAERCSRFVSEEQPAPADRHRCRQPAAV
jgi:hypothetical protein